MNSVDHLKGVEYQETFGQSLLLLHTNFSHAGTN